MILISWAWTLGLLTNPPNFARSKVCYSLIATWWACVSCVMEPLYSLIATWWAFPVWWNRFILWKLPGGRVLCNGTALFSNSYLVGVSCVMEPLYSLIATWWACPVWCNATWWACPVWCNATWWACPVWCNATWWACPVWCNATWWACPVWWRQGPCWQGWGGLCGPHCYGWTPGWGPSRETPNKYLLQYIDSRIIFSNVRT